MSEARRPLVELTIARTKEMLREPEAIFWVFAFPVLLALALGFAFRGRGAEQTPIVISDACGADVRRALAESPALKARVTGEREAAEILRTGKASLHVRCSSEVTFTFDPTRPDARAAKLEASEALQRAAGRRDLVPIREVTIDAPGSRYIDFLLPGLLGMNLMGTGMWGIGFSIVTARMRKLLKRLIATPMKRRDYLLAQIASRLIFLVFEVVILIGFGWLVFDVAVRGSLWLLSLICLIGALAFAGLGLLVASRARTVEGVSGLMNLCMLPMWIGSGVFFSSERFPDAMQPFIQALPLTALNDALRAVILEGQNVVTIAHELGILAAWGSAGFILALRLFRWE